ncbi:SHOCT domain-containing protein [Sphaerisporangium perillae]|uniref:SHOCT domain-containing protein n=1 Tax=Sphaerisporangium perillae TaxID=2935860 RepID=UPI00200D0B29|nr:SHOCT domain-containing protein [Sphaerisporangium perillae]
MAYRIRVFIGALISLVCLGFAFYALYQLIRGGSCASGGNYVSVRQCPPGTEKWAWVLPGSIIGGLLSFFLGTFKGFGPAPEVTGKRAAAGAAYPAREPGAAPFDPAVMFGGRVIVARGRPFTPGGTHGSPADGEDPIARLRKLRDLLDDGTLTPTEFEAAKARILNGM